jgi:hypothetical protein
MALGNITLGKPLTGDTPTALTLVGWSATVQTWSTRGRIWWDCTGSTFTVYRNDGAGATDRLCSGTVTNGAATLSALNSSGISGTVEGAVTSSTGKGIICYTDELMLRSVCAQVASFLVSNKWPDSTGGNYYETAFAMAKTEAEDRITRGGTAPSVPRWRGRPDFTQMVNPADLSRYHALLTANIMQGRQASMNPGGEYEARAYQKQADAFFKSLTIEWPSEVITPMAQLTLRRG